MKRRESLSALKRIVTGWPKDPGVYIMYGKDGEVIYVGKARSLKNRVLSYFSSTEKDAKTEKLVNELSGLSYILTTTESEALILEEKLIKQFHPKYNISLRDDKSYPFVRIESDPSGIPYISIVRRPKGEDRAIFFGPFPVIRLLRMALKGLRFIYPFRSCSRYRRICIYADMGLCPAPCKRKIPEAVARELMENVIKVFSGEYQNVVDKLFERMNRASIRQDFESACFFRDAALSLAAVLGKGIVEQSGILAVYDLKDRLGLSVLPRRIEGFDISNLQGDYAVASMVSFWDGRPDKKNYRRYKIKTVVGIDDSAMIYEVVKRRCQKIVKQEYQRPDLFLIDGGKPQLRSAQRALFETNLDIIPVAIAKKKEQLYMPGKSKPIILPEESAGLRLLRAVRDEAHRFAVTYHRLRRKKGLFGKE